MTINTTLIALFFFAFSGQSHPIHGIIAPIPPPFLSLSFSSSTTKSRKESCQTNPDTLPTLNLQQRGNSFQIRSCNPDAYHVLFEITSNTKQSPPRKAAVISSRHGIQYFRTGINPNDIPFILDIDDSGQIKFILWQSFGDTLNVRLQRQGIIPWAYALTPSGLSLDTNASCSLIESTKLVYLQNIRWEQLSAIRNRPWNQPSHKIEFIDALNITKKSLCPESK